MNFPLRLDETTGRSWVVIAVAEHSRFCVASSALVNCSSLTPSSGCEMFFPASRLTRFNNSISCYLTPGLPPERNQPLQTSIQSTLRLTAGVYVMVTLS